MCADGQLSLHFLGSIVSKPEASQSTNADVPQGN